MKFLVVLLVTIQLVRSLPTEAEKSYNNEDFSRVAQMSGLSADTDSVDRLRTIVEFMAKTPAKHLGMLYNAVTDGKSEGDISTRSKRSIESMVRTLENGFEDGGPFTDLIINPALGNSTTRNISLTENNLGLFTTAQLDVPSFEDCAAVGNVGDFIRRVGDQGHVTHYKKKLYFLPSVKSLSASGEGDFGANKTFTWLEARNYCRKFCMEPISIESMQDYYALVKNFAYANLPHVWTSGRRCSTTGSCSLYKILQPLMLNGWFWTSSGKWISTDVDKDPLADLIWSHSATGLSIEGSRRRQPDNAATKSGFDDELCVVALRYGTEIHPNLHDFPCSAKRYVMCQSSPKLCSMHDLTCGSSFLRLSR